MRRGHRSRYADVVAEESLPAGRGGIGQISRATEPALPAEGDAIVGRGHVAHAHPRADILAGAIDDEDRAAVRGDPRREAVAGSTWRAHIHQAEWPPRRSPVRRDAHDDVVEPVGAEATVLQDDVQPAGHRVEHGRGKPIARPHARRVAALEALDRDRRSEGDTAVVRRLRDFFGGRRSDRRVDERQVAVRPDEGNHPDAPGEEGAGHRDERAPGLAAVVGPAQHDRLLGVVDAVPHAVHPPVVRARGEGVHGDPVLVVEDGAGGVVLHEDGSVEGEAVIVRPLDGDRAAAVLNVERERLRVDGAVGSDGNRRIGGPIEWAARGHGQPGEAARDPRAAAVPRGREAGIDAAA